MTEEKDGQLNNGNNNSNSSSNTTKEATEVKITYVDSGVIVNAKIKNADDDGTIKTRITGIPDIKLAADSNSKISEIKGLDPDFFESAYNVIFPIGNRRLSSNLTKLDLSQYYYNNGYQWTDLPHTYTGFGNLKVCGPAIFNTNDQGKLEETVKKGQTVTYNYSDGENKYNKYTTYLYTEYEGKIHIFKVVEYKLSYNNKVTLKPINGEKPDGQAIIFTLENINNTRFEINSKNKDKITFKIFYKELCNIAPASGIGTRINLYTDNFVGEFKIKYVLDEYDSIENNKIKKGEANNRTKKYRVVFYSTEYYVNGVDKLNVYTSPDSSLNVNINQSSPIQIDSENVNKITTDKRQFILELARELYLNSGFDSYPEKTPASFAKDAINRAITFYNVAKASKVEDVTDPYDNIKTSIYLI